MYLLPLSFRKIFKKFVEPIQSYVPFLGPKWPNCPEQKKFGTNHYYQFLKFLTADPEL